MIFLANIIRISSSALQAFTHPWRAERTTKTSRRAVLAGATAPDPIFAVIAEHEAAYHDDITVCAVQRDLSERCPQKKRGLT